MRFEFRTYWTFESSNLQSLQSIHCGRNVLKPSERLINFDRTQYPNRVHLVHHDNTQVWFI